MIFGYIKFNERYKDMGKSNGTTRMDRIAGELADSAESKLIKSGKEIIDILFDEAQSRLIDAFNKWKARKSSKLKLQELQDYIQASDRMVQIGMDKKEIAVIWAMRELGYTQENIHEVLDLANKAYLSNGEK